MQKFRCLRHQWAQEAFRRFKVQLTPEKLGFATFSVLTVHTNCPERKDRAVYFRMINGVVERVSVIEGGFPQAELTITGDYETFASISRAELNAASAPMSRKLAMKGNPMRASRLAPVVYRLNEVLSTIPTHYHGELRVEPEDSSASSVCHHGSTASATSAFQKDTTSDWRVVHAIPGRVRIKNPILYRRERCCREIERVVCNAVGVEEVKVSPKTASVLIEYDVAKTTKVELIDTLERGLQALADKNLRLDEPRLDRSAILVFSLGVNAAAMVFPPLTPVGVGLALFTIWPIVKKASFALCERKTRMDLEHSSYPTGKRFYAIEGRPEFCTVVKIEKV